MIRRNRGGSKGAVVSIVGRSDSGKTILIEKLIPELIRRGIRVGTIKHDVHGFEMDREGKDSYRHKKAGALITVISSPRRVGMVRDSGHDHSVAELREAYFQDVDLILTEGYKRESWPKIEVYREMLGPGLLTRPEEGLIAVITDDELGRMEEEVAFFHKGDVPALADFLIEYFHLKSNRDIE